MSPRGAAATQRGAAAEREIALWLSAQTGWPVRRKLGAGRKDDVGDLDGVPDCTVQVVSRTSTTDLATAMRIKPRQCEIQQANAGTTHGVTLARIVPGLWLALLTPRQEAEVRLIGSAVQWHGLWIATLPDWVEAHTEALG